MVVGISSIKLNLLNKVVAGIALDCVILVRFLFPEELHLF